MFIDELTLHFKAGRGGDGVVRWRHEKGREFSGPAGGSGGKGGDVYAVAVRDIGILNAYRTIDGFKAEDGEAGGSNIKQGRSGDDKEIKFPIGSRIKNLNTGHILELLEDGESLLLLHGGRGGLGNAHFKSSTNIRPTEHTDGDKGEESDFYIELLMVADFGLVGLPNAGKSSLLNTLTKAKSKVGDFPFTTIEPNLGNLYGHIVADIPGLIGGASSGKGLGYKFLRHIERTKSLVHCISAEDLDPRASYKIIRSELKTYGRGLEDKSELVLLTKVDTISNEEKAEKLSMLKSVNPNTTYVSILDDKLVKALSDLLISITS